MGQNQDVVKPSCFNCTDEGIYYNAHFQAYEPCNLCDVYGVDRFYLNDPREARNLQRLTRDKTMSTDQMEALKDLADIEFEEVLPQREVPM